MTPLDKVDFGFLFPFVNALNGGTLYPLFIVLVIILYVLIPPRYTQKYTPGMLKRIGIGLCLITVSLICSLTMDTAGHIGNHNATCVFFVGYSS